MDIKQAIAFAKKNKVLFVSVKFGDLLGKWHQITVPVHELNPSLFERGKGIGFDGSSVAGFTQVKAGDMIVIPIPETGFMDPFADLPTMTFIGDVIDVATGQKFERNPRYVAEKAERHLKNSGIAPQSFWGPEFEFYLFDSVRYANLPQNSFYQVDCGEADWNTGRDENPNLGYKMPHKGGYHAVPPQDSSFNFRSALCLTMEKCGVPVKYHHHEVGGSGQLEIEVMFDTLTKMADRSMLVKYLVRNAAFKAGMTATFMPKPMVGEPGNGMHVHQYLAKDGHSLFYKKDGIAHMSALAMHYLGGLLKHAPALLAFTNPSTNSYRRLVPGFEAPVNLVYSARNRSAAIRIPLAGTSPAAKRIEFRAPDPSCNPFLAFSAQLMAGLDGVLNHIEPPAPVDKDLYELPPEEHEGIKQVPSSLAEAMDALEEDHDFLTAGDVFTDDLIETWIGLKRDEIDQARLAPTPLEYELYFHI